MSQRAQFVWSVGVLLGLGFAQSPHQLLAVEQDTPRETISEAEQYVHQALEFRVEGDTKYSQMLLRLALRESPDYAPAHWASGEVQIDGKWVTVADAQAHFKNDPDLKEYRELRERLVDSPEADLRLARWCRKQGWEDSERIHLVRQLRNPDTTDKLRVEAMRQLGYQEFEGALRTRQEIRQIQQLRNRDHQVQQKWVAKVERWAGQLKSARSATREHALQQLQEVTDFNAIPAIEAVLAMGECEFASEAVQTIGRINSPESTRSLVCVALHSLDAAAVQMATELLRARPPHDYAPLLLASLTAKLESRFRVVTDPSGLVYHEHVVRQAGAKGDRVAVRRNLAVPEQVTVRNREGDQNRERNLALENQLRRQLELARLSQEALNIEGHVAESNRSLEHANARVYALLRTLTEAQVPSNAEAWWDWWQGYNEVYAYDRPTQTSYVDTSRRYQVLIRGASCFAAGTPVWTDQGMRPIEDLQPGDRVFSQNVDTGELGFRVVANTTIRPAAPLLQIRVAETQVLTTTGHPFWVDGTGWRMAKLLEEGDVIYTTNGSVPIESIDEVAAQEAFNLVVDQTHNYFVGDAGILVHDNNYRQPTRAVTPGLQR